MLNKIIIIISVLILSSCATGPKGYFKRSANNKIFDTRGFKGTKRAPIYNKKYIAKAKYNVATNNYEIDDDEFDDDLLENENISRANRQMYRSMLEDDVEHNYLGRSRKSRNKPYPSIRRNSARIIDYEEAENLELKAELHQIKSMLRETKDEMASYKCPTAAELERAQITLDARSNHKHNKVKNREYSDKALMGL